MTGRRFWSTLVLACHASAIFGQLRPNLPAPPRQTTATSPLATAKRVDLRHTHERLVAVVPLVGSGTAADPKRPKHAPGPRQRGVSPSPTGIIGYAYQLTDDGQNAIVEFVALDRAAFAPILADRSADVKSFLKGREKREDIEKELIKVKRNLDLDTLGVRIP